MNQKHSIWFFTGLLLEFCGGRSPSCRAMGTRPSAGYTFSAFQVLRFCRVGLPSHALRHSKFGIFTIIKKLKA